MIGPIFAKLYAAYGDQHWWAADSTFEIMIGTVLVQDTSWSDVEKFLATARQHNLLTPSAFLSGNNQWEKWIPSSDFSHKKNRRLQGFTQWYFEQGGFEKLDKLDSVDLRNSLLRVDGLAKETADAILLYAFKRPVFVVDTHTRRLFHRVGIFNGDQSYEELQHLIELSLDSDVELFNEYHALIVRHAREHCHIKPKCDACPIDDLCIYTSKLFKNK